MGETVNISEIADKLSADIFKYFGWKAHPKKNDNFPCVNASHTTGGKSPKPKKEHPADVVFYYDDPYLGRRIYLHTDLKSYGKDAITMTKLRSAIESLAMAVSCARVSSAWRTKYSISDEDNYDVRGLLFVHNHDGKFTGVFDEVVAKTNLSSIPVEPNVYIHFLGPSDISRLFTIANDIVRLQHQQTLPESYSFYYPDLVLWRRHGDVFNQPATIECLTAPYFVITYESKDKSPPGYLIYYNRSGESVGEFEYFIDSLSRYQMLEPGKFIRVRIVAATPNDEHLSHFDAAKIRYARAWGFDQSRVAILDDIKLERVTAVATTYSAPVIGWRAPK
jgi:hypothetical protein